MAVTNIPQMLQTGPTAQSQARMKLALQMLQQQPVRHPVQGWANGLSQIAGTYLMLQEGKRADAKQAGIAETMKRATEAGTKGTMWNSPDALYDDGAGGMASDATGALKIPAGGEVPGSGYKPGIGAMAAIMAGNPDTAMAGLQLTQQEIVAKQAAAAAAAAGDLDWDRKKQLQQMKDDAALERKRIGGDGPTMTTMLPDGTKITFSASGQPLSATSSSGVEMNLPPQAAAAPALGGSPASAPMPPSLAPAPAPAPTPAPVAPVAPSGVPLNVPGADPVSTFPGAPATGPGVTPAGSGQPVPTSGRGTILEAIRTNPIPQGQTAEQFAQYLEGALNTNDLEIKAALQQRIAGLRGQPMPEQTTFVGDNFRESAVPPPQGQTSWINMGGEGKAVPAAFVEYVSGGPKLAVESDTNMMFNTPRVKLTDSMAKKIADDLMLVDGQLARLRTIEERFSREQFTYRNEGLEMLYGFLDKLDVSSPQQQEFLRERARLMQPVMQNLSQTLKEMSGQAVTKVEFDRIKGYTINPDGDPTTSKQNLLDGLSYLESVRARTAAALQFGVNLSGHDTQIPLSMMDKYGKDYYLSEYMRDYRSYKDADGNVVTRTDPELLDFWRKLALDNK
jgi:hypothetical protein